MSSHATLIEQAHGSTRDGSYKGQLCSLGGKAHETGLHVEVTVWG